MIGDVRGTYQRSISVGMAMSSTSASERDYYCAPSVWVHAPSGVITDDMEYHQARFLGSPYCGKLGVPFVQDPPHRHHGHDLLVVTHGTCKLLIEETTEYTLIPGSILILPGGNGHRRIVDGTTCCCGIEISPDYFHDYLKVSELASLARGYTQRVCAMKDGLAVPAGEPLPALLVYDHRAHRTFLNLFEECLQAYNQVTPLRSHFIYTFGSLFAQFLLGLLQQSPTAATSPTAPQRMLEIKRWLDRHFTEETSIPQLAEKANLSPHWFGTVFRNTVGVSPKAYLITLRMQHAAYLLEETTYSITDIAYRVGYNDLANFIRAFTSRYHNSPQAYRQQHNQIIH